MPHNLSYRALPSFMSVCPSVCLVCDQGPLHLDFFHRNSNLMEILFHFHLDSNTVIVTKFCTWHDSCAAVVCTKNCCNLMASNGITARRSFHRIWNAGKKIVNETGPSILTVSLLLIIRAKTWKRIPTSKLVRIINQYDPEFCLVSLLGPSAFDRVYWAPTLVH